MSYEQLVASVDALRDTNEELASTVLATQAGMAEVKTQSIAARDQAESFAIDALGYVEQCQELTIEAQQAAVDAGDAAFTKVNDAMVLLAGSTGATKIGAILPSGEVGTVQAALNAIRKNESLSFDTNASFLAAIIANDISAVYLNGYYSAGDGGAHLKVRISTPSPVKPWHSQSTDGAWWEIKADHVSLPMFGGKRTYAFDNRQPLLDSISYATQFRKPIIDMGVYGVVGSIEIGSYPVTIQGLGPVAKMHYQTYDDKRWMRRGTDTDGVLFKDKIPGLAFIFKNGGPVVTHALANRTDDYASVKPCMTFSANGNSILTYSVIQDNDCFDEAGAYVPKGAENTATDFNMGIFIKDGARNTIDNPTVWGYFKRSGLTVWSTSGNDDPDGNIVWGGMYYGRHGVSLLGASGPTGQVPGLSGTTFYAPTIGSMDHNSRVANVGGFTVADYYVDADADKWRCVYIDGDVSANTAEIAGHFFIGAILRTSANYPVELGYCSSVKFSNGIQESGNYGVPGSNTTKWLASVNTSHGVTIEEMRAAELDAFFHAEFAGRIAFKIRGGISGGYSDIFSKPDPNVAGGWSVAKIGTGRGVGDVGMQFTTDLASENNGFNLGLDVSEGTFKLWKSGTEVFSANAQGALAPKLLTEQRGATLTVASGVITVTTAFHVVNGEGLVADDLVTINGGVTDGQLLTIRIGTGTLTLKHGTGNIRCGADKVLNNSLDRIVLEYVLASSLWVCRSYQDNG